MNAMDPEVHNPFKSLNSLIFTLYRAVLTIIPMMKMMIKMKSKINNLSQL